eukprot:g6874.t1
MVLLVRKHALLVLALALATATAAAATAASAFECTRKFYGVACAATQVSVRTNAMGSPTEIRLVRGPGGTSKEAKSEVKKMKLRSRNIKVTWESKLHDGAKVWEGNTLVVAEAHDFLNQGHLMKDCFIPLCLIARELQPSVVALPLQCSWFGAGCAQKLSDLLTALLPGLTVLTPTDMEEETPAAFTTPTVVSLYEDIAAEGQGAITFPPAWQRGLPSCANHVLPKLLGPSRPKRGKRPSLVFVSRKKSRKLLNEDELVKVAQASGFDARLVSDWNLPIGEQARLMQSSDVFVAVHGAVWGNSAFLRRGSVVIQLVPDCMWDRPVYHMCFKNPNKKVLYYKKMSELTGATYLEWDTPHESQTCPDADEDPYCRGGHAKDVTVPADQFRSLLKQALKALNANGGVGVGSGDVAEHKTVSKKRAVWPGIAENVKVKELVDAAASAAAASEGGEADEEEEPQDDPKQLGALLTAFYKEHLFDWKAFARIWRIVARSSSENSKCEKEVRRAPRAAVAATLKIARLKKTEMCREVDTGGCGWLGRMHVDNAGVLVGGSQVSWPQKGKHGKLNGKLLRFGYSCEGCPGHKPRKGDRIQEYEIAQRLHALPAAARQHFVDVTFCQRCPPSIFRKYGWFKRACDHLKHAEDTKGVRKESGNWAYDEFICDGIDGHGGWQDEAHVFTEVERNKLDENGLKGGHIFGGLGVYDNTFALGLVLQAAASLTIAHASFGFVHNDVGVNADFNRPRVQNFGAIVEDVSGNGGRCICYDLPPVTGVHRPLCMNTRTTKGHVVRFYDYDNAKQKQDGETFKFKGKLMQKAELMHPQEIQHVSRALLRQFAEFDLDENLRDNT